MARSRACRKVSSWRWRSSWGISWWPRTISSRPRSGALEMAALPAVLELYDDLTARTKVDNAQAVIAWLRSRIPS